MSVPESQRRILAYIASSDETHVDCWVIAHNLGLGRNYVRLLLGRLEKVECVKRSRGYPRAMFASITDEGRNLVA